MNAQDITFGIEIETTIPAGTIPVGPHGRGCDIAQLPGWKADADPSIHAAAGREGCEFVSPVFQGTAGLRQLLAALVVIRGLGAQVNRSCGLHIHVGFDKTNTEASAKLATLVANFEKAIFASTGTKNRERGRWCAPLQQYGQAASAILASRRNRYHLANFGTVKPTVEFRAFSASLNADKIVAYIRMVVAIVERSHRMTRATNWAAKIPVASSPIHRAGEGQTALTRLFYHLGWTKGRQPYTHGDLTGDALAPLAKSKKVLMTLARKYDAQP